MPRKAALGVVSERRGAVVLVKIVCHDVKGLDELEHAIE